jgi:hypothetical protein
VGFSGGEGFSQILFLFLFLVIFIIKREASAPLFARHVEDVFSPACAFELRPFEEEDEDEDDDDEAAKSGS